MPTCAHLRWLVMRTETSSLAASELEDPRQGKPPVPSPQTQGRAFLGTLPNTPKSLWSNMFPNPCPPSPAG